MELDLQICMDHWQHHLQPGDVLRVWRVGRLEVIAELPVSILVHLVAHYLTGAGLTAEVLVITGRLPPTAPARRPPLPLAGRSDELRAARRKQRRSRKRA